MGAGVGPGMSSTRQDRKVCTPDRAPWCLRPGHQPALTPEPQHSCPMNAMGVEHRPPHSFPQEPEAADWVWPGTAGTGGPNLHRAGGGEMPVYTTVPGGLGCP